jgi:DOPA 4,5-dioxygenase
MEAFMAEGFVEAGRINGYHAHVYYDPETRARAERLRAEIAERFAARLGSWHDEPVGPHPIAMYQVAFAIDEFSRLVPWLMLNREGLNVLVHPITEDAVADHSRHALWLGRPVPLRLEVLRRNAATG